jgi:predicted transposase/invertase (TIGR01784 family)
MKPIEELTFTDDYMFGYVMQNKKVCKGLLERLLNIKIEKLEYPKLQKTISPHFKSKGVRLDVYVEDSNRVFDIEIQNILDDELPTRTRYYQSMMDIDLLSKGKEYSQLKENFIVFICKDDFFGEDFPCYTFSNRCHEKLTLDLGDKCRKIFFNASAFEKEKNIEIKSILEYIINKKSSTDFTKMIDQIVERAKENKTFRGDYMIWGLAEYDAEKRGYKAGILETAKNLIIKNVPLETIAECTGLSLETVEKLAESLLVKN